MLKKINTYARYNDNTIMLNNVNDEFGFVVINYALTM